MLTRTDLQRGLGTLGAIAEQASDAAAFARAGVRELSSLVGSDLTTLSVCHLKTGRRDVVGFPEARLDAEDRACFDRFFSAHPLVRYHAYERGRGARRISDSMAFSRFRHSALYCEYYRRVGLDHAVAVPVSVDEGVLVSFVLNRSGRDFADRDCQLLDQVGPVLRRLYLALGSTGVAGQPVRVAPVLLTRREREALDWVAAGKTDREVGVLLGCSHRTVQKHLQHVFEKLGVETRTAAVMRAIGRGPI